MPARYGGFESAVEEVGKRLVQRGHSVVVYCRNEGQELDRYLGMKLVNLPAVRSKHFETLSHTGVSVAHLCLHRCDAAILFNAANAPFLPALRARGIPTALHVDGLEWRRAKWGGAGKRYYLWAERMGVRAARRLIADARGIQDYYRERHAVDSTFIPYGAPIINHVGCNRLVEANLVSGQFHLVVARMEPENNVDMIVNGFRDSGASLPLAVVGSAPHAEAYSAKVRRAAEGADVRFLGSVWDQDLLNQLYANSALYLHGHSVGGTNPSLLRAMGAAAPTAALDVDFNREVLGGEGKYFADPDAVAASVRWAEGRNGEATACGAALQRRAALCYDWDEVATGYELLVQDLIESNGRPARRAASR